jgi:hypothetical protein
LHPGSCHFGSWPLTSLAMDRVHRAVHRCSLRRRGSTVQCGGLGPFTPDRDPIFRIEPVSYGTCVF